jgi:hypothetical protein
VSGQPRAPAALPLGKNPRYTLNMRIGDSHSMAGPFEKIEGFSSRREMNVISVVRLLTHPYTNWANQVIINKLYYEDQS